jgi:hypothetical protein
MPKRYNRLIGNRLKPPNHKPGRILQQEYFNSKWLKLLKITTESR